MSTVAAKRPLSRTRLRSRKAHRGPRERSRLHSALLWLGVVLTIVFCLFPFYWIINTSLKTGAELSTGHVFPHNPSLTRS